MKRLISILPLVLSFAVAATYLKPAHAKSSQPVNNGDCCGAVEPIVSYPRYYGTVDPYPIGYYPYQANYGFTAGYNRYALGYYPYSYENYPSFLSYFWGYYGYPGWGGFYPYGSYAAGFYPYGAYRGGFYPYGAYRGGLNPYGAYVSPF